MKKQPRKGLTRRLVPGLVLILLVVGLWLIRDHYGALLQRETTLDQAYTVKQAADGNLTVVDKGHGRVIRLTREGDFLWSADMPMGNTGTALYADDVTVGADGMTYVQVSDWDGMHIDRELILVYDDRGRWTESLRAAVYECDTVNKHSRFGLSTQGDRIVYLQADGDGLTLTDVRDPQTVFRSYGDAATRVADACIRETGWLVLDKNGSIYEVNDGEKRALYNSALDTRANRSPYRMAWNPMGGIVFTDIRDRSVQRLTDDPSMTETLWRDTDAQTAGLDPEGKLILAEPGRILFPDESRELTEWHWSTGIRALRTVTLVMIGIAGVILLYYLILGIGVLKKIRLSGAQRTGLLLMFCVIIAVSLVCVKLIDGFRDTYRDKIQEELKVTAYMVANLVDGDDIAKVNTAADFDSEFYRQLVEDMQWAFEADVDLYDQVYCNILRTDRDGHAWAIAYYDQSIGTYFPLDEGEVAETLEVTETRRPVWSASTSLVSGVFCYVKVPVFASDGSVSGVIEVGTETKVLENMISDVSRQLLMTLLVLILVIWLAVGELMAYSGAEEKYRGRIRTAEKKEGVLPGHLIRLLVFVIFTAYNMTASFLPVYILRSTAEGVFGDRELMASLPLTLNIFFIGTMALCCAGLLHRMRIRTLTVFSALFSMAGNLLIFLVPTYPCILLGLGLDGIGMGLVSNAVYVLITRVRDEKERLSGFTVYNAACVSGINFGMMLGSILAANFNQHMVFACAAVLWLVVVGITVSVDRHTGNLTASEEENRAHSPIGTASFLRRRGIGAFMVLIQNPYIIFNSFAYYFVPLFCDDMGMGETTVSLLLMIYSLFAVYLSDTITKAVDRKIGAKAMYTALTLNVAAILLFARWQTMPMLVAALVMMGLSASFGKSVQQNYFMGLPPVQDYGEDRAIGLYNFTENIGESLGPAVFGKLAVFTPRGLGFSIFGGIAALCGGLHLILFNRGGKQKK